MNATYFVLALPERDMLRITLSGFFGPDDVAAFDHARQRAHRQLQCPPHQHVTLVDLREMKIQAQDLLPRFSAIIGDPATRPRRLAFVMGSSLARGQLKRLIARDDIAFFTDQSSAEAWLAEPAQGYALAG